MNLEMRLYTLLPLPPCGIWPERARVGRSIVGLKMLDAVFAEVAAWRSEMTPLSAQNWFRWCASMTKSQPVPRGCTPPHPGRSFTPTGGDR